MPVAVLKHLGLYQRPKGSDEAIKGHMSTCYNGFLSTQPRAASNTGLPRVVWTSSLLWSLCRAFKAYNVAKPSKMGPNRFLPFSLLRRKLRQKAHSIVAEQQLNPYFQNIQSLHV